MKNRKMLIFIILIFIFNAILIMSGIYLNSQNKDESIEMFEESFKTNLFAKTISKGESKTYDEMKYSLDSYYEDSEGQTVKGIEKDEEGNLIFDSAKQSRENVSLSFFSNYISFEDLNFVAVNTNTDLTAIESKENLAMVMIIDKGADAKLLNYLGPNIQGLPQLILNNNDEQDALVKILLIEGLLPHGLEAGIDFANLWGMIEDIVTFADGTEFFDFFAYIEEEFGIGRLEWVAAHAAINTAVEIIDSKLSKIKLDLFETPSLLTYEEEINGEKTEVTYDFSSRLTMDNYIGVDGEKIGIENWDVVELDTYFEQVSINTDLLNKGDYHQSITFSNAFALDSNSFTDFNKYLSNITERYNGEEYSYYQFEELKNDTWAVLSGREVAVDSQGEAFLYDIYKKLDYTEYFDRALESDGLNSYDYKYASVLYDNKTMLPENYSSKYESDVYHRGQSGVTFADFVFISKTYRPFLRSSNIDYFVHDIATLVYE